MVNELHPTPAQKRIDGIDILRGVALFGILLVNTLGFNASFFDFGGYYNSLPDEFQKAFYQVYISLTADKFIFLFSFLFGYGIYMQYDKFKDEPKKFRAFFMRRMFLLGLFGMAHALFLWAGDILLLYAISGFIMLLFYKLSTKWLVPLALFFYFFIVIWLMADVWLELPNAMSSTCPECLEMAKNVYPEGNYFQCMKLRIEEYYAFRNINAIYYLSKVVGIVILGFLASKFDLYHRIISNRLRWTLIIVLGAVIGTVIYFGHESIVDFESPFANAVYMLGYELMNVFIAGSYLLSVLLLVSFDPVAKVLKPVAYMGRMSLTNYMTQSLILSIVFYGWGFGFFGQTNVIRLVWLALGVYVFQMILATVWFRYYKQGPLEKLWRHFSYRS